MIARRFFAFLECDILVVHRCRSFEDLSARVAEARRFKRPFLTLRYRGQWEPFDFDGSAA
jgi:hypothetical protein